MNVVYYPALSRDPSDHPRRKREQSPEELQRPADRESDDPERQQEQPHYWVENQGDNGKRPAQDQKNAPQQKFGHLT